MRHAQSQLDTKEFQLVTYRGKVTHVADGDTFTCTIKFKLFAPPETLKIRLNGLNTPELSKQDPFAQEAAEYTRSRLLGRTVSVVLARHRGSASFVTGNFGREIGLVYPRWWSKTLNEELLERGLARLYDKPCGWMTRSWWRRFERCWRSAVRYHRGLHVAPVQTGGSGRFLWGVGVGIGLLLIFLLLWI